MKKAIHRRKARHFDTGALDALIEEVTVDAYGEDEQLWAFRQAFEDNVDLPCAGSVRGEPVAVISVDYDGNERRGLTAKCRSASGQEHMVAAADVAMPANSECGRYLAAYRKWMGLAPCPPVAAPTGNKARLTVAKAGLDLADLWKLIVLSLKQKAARCRVLMNGGEIALRATRLWDVVPGCVPRAEIPRIVAPTSERLVAPPQPPPKFRECFPRAGGGVLGGLWRSMEKGVAAIQADTLWGTAPGFRLRDKRAREREWKK